MRTSITIPVAALLFALHSACEASRANGGGCVFGTPITDVYDDQVPRDPGQVWDSVRSTVGQIAEGATYCEDLTHRFTARVHGAQVTVMVQALGPQKTVLHVAAVKLGAGDSATATLVKDKILSDLERKR